MFRDIDVHLTDGQKTLRLEAHRFAAEVLRPASIELDRMANPEDVGAAGSPLWDALRKTYQLGYVSAALPEALGGAGLGPLDHSILLEEFAWGCMGLGISIATAAAPFGSILLKPTDRLIRDYLAPFAADRDAKYIGCWAVTEPMHGSDTLMSTQPGFDPFNSYAARARLEGDEWVIDGQKAAWVSNAPIATHSLIFAHMETPSGKGAGIAFVPLDFPGVTKGKALDKIGQRSLTQGEVFLDNVRIPKEFMLVEPAAYPSTHELTFAGANATVATCCVGLAQAAFDEALEYSKGRIQGDKVICEHQLIQKKLFDMFTKVNTARYYARAAVLYNAENPGKGIAYSMSAKVYASQIAFEVASEAVQIFGVLGLSKEVLVEKLFRDARATMVEDGASDTLALIAARRIIDQ